MGKNWAESKQMSTHLFKYEKLWYFRGTNEKRDTGFKQGHSKFWDVFILILNSEKQRLSIDILKFFCKKKKT